MNQLLPFKEEALGHRETGCNQVQTFILVTNITYSYASPD